MKKLTEEMVVARARQSNLESVVRLNCWGCELSDVSLLRQLTNVEILSLSVNKITGLSDFQNCLKLRDLFVRRNEISDLNQICYLKPLKSLRNLNLAENPCSCSEGYRLTVLHCLPNLEKLDDRDVSAEELRDAILLGKDLVHPEERSMDLPEQKVFANNSPSGFDYINDKSTLTSQSLSSGTDFYDREGSSYSESQHPSRSNLYYASPENQENEDSNGLGAYQEEDDQTSNNSTPNHIQNDFGHILPSPPPLTMPSAVFQDMNNFPQYGHLYNGVIPPLPKLHLMRNPNVENVNVGTPTTPRPYICPNCEVFHQCPHGWDRLYCSEHQDPASRLPPPYSPPQQRPTPKVDSPAGPTPRPDIYSACDRCHCPSWQARLYCSEHQDPTNRIPPSFTSTPQRPTVKNSNILNAVLSLVRELDYSDLELANTAIRCRMDELR